MVYFYCYGGGSVGGEVVIFDILYIELMPFDLMFGICFFRGAWVRESLRIAIEGLRKEG